MLLLMYRYDKADLEINEYRKGQLTLRAGCDAIQVSIAQCSCTIICYMLYLPILPSLLSGVLICARSSSILKGGVVAVKAL
jgi:hypothetical protein